MTKKECYLITVALEHRLLFNDWPITSEPLRIAKISTDEEAEKMCKCMVHTDSNIDLSLLMMLRNTMACCCELGGRFLSGNLTNMTIHLLMYILHTKAGLTNLQIQAEIKSDASAAVAGSKMVIDFGYGEHNVSHPWLLH